jgi:ABC-type nitrate/sulfonate/bicarbonate transport system substrate-binding protein
MMRALVHAPVRAAVDPTRHGLRPPAEGWQAEGHKDLTMRPTSGWRTATIALLGVAALGLSACGGSDDSGSGGDDGPFTGIKLARTSSLDSGEINDVVGPVELGEKYGVQMSDSDIEDFQSPSTALQVVLSGESSIVTGSSISIFQAIEQGLPVKIFCPQSAGYDTRIVATGDIDSLEALGENLDVPIAIEGPGGPVNMLMDLVLEAKGLDYRSGDFTNPTILEDNPARLSALLNGDVQVTVLNAYQIPTVEEELGADNVHVLSNIMADMEGGVVNAGYAAPVKWLEENEAAAVAFCASVLEANQLLTEDFDYYKEMNDKYLEPDMEEDLLRQNWDAITAEKLFPYGDDTITQAGIDSFVQVALDNGVLEEKLAYEDIVAEKILRSAEALVKEKA